MVIPPQAGFLHMVRARALRGVGGIAEALEAARRAVWLVSGEGGEEGGEEGGLMGQALALVRELMEEDPSTRGLRLRHASSTVGGKEGEGGGMLLVGYTDGAGVGEEGEALLMVQSAAAFNDTVVVVHGVQGAREYLASLLCPSSSCPSSPCPSCPSSSCPSLALSPASPRRLVLVAPAKSTLLLARSSCIQHQHHNMGQRVLLPAGVTRHTDSGPLEGRRRGVWPWAPSVYREVGAGAMLGEAQDVWRVLNALEGGGEEGEEEVMTRQLASVYLEQYMGRPPTGGEDADPRRQGGEGGKR
jgi:hypothetical protein